MSLCDYWRLWAGVWAIDGPSAVVLPDRDETLQRRPCGEGLEATGGPPCVRVQVHTPSSSHMSSLDTTFDTPKSDGLRHGNSFIQAISKMRLADDNP